MNVLHEMSNIDDLQWPFPIHTVEYHFDVKLVRYPWVCNFAT